MGSEMCIRDRWWLYANRFVQSVGTVCLADGRAGFSLLLALLIGLFVGKQYAVTAGLAIDSSLAALWQPATNWPDSGPLPLGGSPFNLGRTVQDAVVALL